MFLLCFLFILILDKALLMCRDGTIHLPPDSMLSRYLGADTICIAFFLRISILQVLRFNIAVLRFSFFVFNSRPWEKVE